jgi:hypothetical protein
MQANEYAATHSSDSFDVQLFVYNAAAMADFFKKAPQNDAHTMISP